MVYRKISNEESHFSYKSLLILLTQAIYGSEQMQVKSIGSSINMCKGYDVDMHWNVYKEEKETKLRWYFNNTNICNNFPEDGFTVKIPYQGRIEKIDKTDIKLKNVSLDDEGTYILDDLGDWSTNNTMKKIFLRVLEPPTNKCNCKMLLSQDSTSELKASYCGRPIVSPRWERKQTSDALGDGDSNLNSAVQDDEILCCLDGEAMQCVNDKKWFCTTVRISDRDDQRPTGNGNTQHADSVTVTVFRGRDHGSISFEQLEEIISNFYHVKEYLLVLMSLTLIMMVVFTLYVVARMKYCRKCKKKKDLDTRLDAEEAMTMYPVMNDSETEVEHQPQQHNTLYPRLEKLLNHTINHSESDTEFQILRHANPKLKLHPREVNTMYHPDEYFGTAAPSLGAAVPVIDQILVETDDL